MIKLFVTDLDGCVSYPFKTPDWDAINRLREINRKSGNSDGMIPPLTICTGRPFPYAEAVAQWLDVRLPFVFESAGLFHWDGFRIETALKDGENELEPIRTMRSWLEKEVLPDFPGSALEFTKMMDAGVVSPDEDVIDRIYERVMIRIKNEFPDLEVHTTEVSVNILMPGNDKLQGMKLLGASLGVDLQEMAYIGDSSGDVPALKHVKFPFSPKNARQIAKDHSEVLPFETTRAVVEAYERVIKYNRSQV